MPLITVKNISFTCRYRVLAVVGVFFLVAFSSVRAQSLNVRISIPSTASARISVDVQLPNATKNLSFPNAYAGVLGLGGRIEAVKGIRDNGESVLLQNSAAGEFQSQENFSRFTYEVNLKEPPKPAQISHVSSLTADRAVLMLADLLPQTSSDSTSALSTQIDIVAPRGWKITSNADYDGRQYSTDDPENALFMISPSVNEKRQKLAASKFDLDLVTSGKWPFSDSDAGKLIGRILAEYYRITRFELKRNTVVMVVPYPGEVGPESWTAETRGNAVVLVLGAKANRKRVLAQLGIVLSHELFHLWVPNSLKLQGDYDWFFEGFTLYQALRMDLHLGLISFDDFLDTIAHVYDSYRSAPGRDQLSLLEASERRWTTSSALVYDKGMLVAFLYDLSLRKLTDCKESLDDVYAELFRLPATGQSSANETIIRILGRSEELKSMMRDYVENAVPVNLEPIISAYGIQLQSGPGATKLILDRKAGDSQRKLLACLR